MASLGKYFTANLCMKKNIFVSKPSKKYSNGELNLAEDLYKLNICTTINVLIQVQY